MKLWLGKVKIEFVLGLALTTLLVTTASAGELFSAPPESELKERTVQHYTKFPLVMGIDGGAPIVQKQGGRLTRLGYELPAGFEPFHLVNNYKAQIVALGGEVLFECEEKACGRVKGLKNLLEPSSNILSGKAALLVAKLSHETKPIYLSLYSVKTNNRTGLQVDVIEDVEEPLDLISVDAAYLSAPVEVLTFEDKSGKDRQGSKDHPMVQRLPGARIVEYTQLGFGRTKVLTAVTEKREHQIVALDGKITDIGYKLPRQYSEYEAFANYQSALSKLGFVPQFRCEGKECGDEDKLHEGLNTLVHIGNEKDQFYGLYKLDRPEGNVYAMVYVIGFSGGLWGELRVIEETELKDDRLVIDLEGLTDKIAQTGHVALDGLLFKFDSDQMLPESKAVINTLATYLKAHPDWKFYVVGHTDDKGSESYNQKLADKRAKSVVKALTSEYQIPKRQLVAKGVGEYAPVANNLNEDGQKQNRRVELVLRSDTK
ncbi:Outer membrane porin F precursor [Grimontia celer]|uniref:Outer membrane porin F n=1 Tax=Grimontia celer TaxID=1796497 RepID=A0A128F906_9GAMM|nr:OmpA family protein [Grimontia celer]CZF83228.1 Outer membrane porin F precursor [Grimontia celer]